MSSTKVWIGILNDDCDCGNDLDLQCTESITLN